MNGVSFISHKFLSHPLLLEECQEMSAIASFQPKYIMPILKNVLVENVKFESFNKKTQLWFLQCTSFALRIVATANSEEAKIFDYALNFYNKIHEKGSYEIESKGTLDENTEFLVSQSLIHLSQIFQNPLFYCEPARLKSFQQNIRNNFTSEKIDWPLKIQRLLIDVILCGTRSFAESFDKSESSKQVAKDYGSLAFDVLKRFDCKNIEEIDYFNPHFDALLKYQFFIDTWIERFEKLYKSLIFNKKISKQILNFIIKTITEKFSRFDQTRAFSAVVNTWILYENMHEKSFVESKWTDLKTISNTFLKWFDIKSEWYFVGSCANYKQHPLFILASRAPDYESCKEIHETLEKYIIHILNIKEGEETKAFWLFPIHARKYLIKWPLFSKYTDDFVNYINHVVKSINSEESRMKITETLRGIKDDTEKLIAEITVSLTSIISAINIYNESIDVFPFLEQNSKDKTFELIKLIYYLIKDKKQLFWNAANKSLKSSTILPMITLLVGAGQHIIPNDLFCSMKESSVPFILWVIENVTRKVFDEYPEELTRILFGLIGIANDTTFFYENKEAAARILKWGKTCPNDTSIINLFEMLKLTIITGGGSMNLTAEERSHLQQQPDATYITPQYIISVYKNSILINHPLGSIVYNIDKRFDIKNIGSCVSQGRERQRVPSPRKNSEDHTISVARSIDSLLASDESDEYGDDDYDFPSYSYSQKKIGGSLGRSLLTDFDLLLFKDNYVRHPPSQVKLSELDKKTIVPIFPVPVLHLTNDKQPVIRKTDTAASKRLLSALRNNDNEEVVNFTTHLMKVSYAFCDVPPIQPTGMVKTREPIAIVLNESGSSLIHSSSSFEAFNSIIEIVPQENGFFDVHMSFDNKVAEDEKFVTDNFCFCISDEKLGRFIALLIVMMFTSKSSKTHSLQLSAAYLQRKTLIQKYFEGGSFGTTSILVDLIPKNQ